MLRKLSATFFATTNQSRQICLKQCTTDSNKPNITPEEQAKRRAESFGGTLMLALLLTPPSFKNMMFPSIFHAPADKVPTLFDIIRDAHDFNQLIEKLPRSKKSALVRTLCIDIETLKKAIEPLSSLNQRRLLDFVGLDRIVKIGKKDSILSQESRALEFFMISESLNSVLRRKNHNYLYEMQEREQVTIAARPGLGQII